LLHDSSVIRNFCVLDWLEVLLDLSGRRLFVVPDVVAPPDEPSEMGDRLKAFDRDFVNARAGSPEATRALVATQAISALLGKIGAEVLVIQPSTSALELGRRLLNPTPSDRSAFGLRVRRLSAAEAVSLAVAIEMHIGFATDDKAAAGVYTKLGGGQHKWTLDLFRDAVEKELLSESSARQGYERLLRDERFRGIPWD
jgi:hypothetical protein